MLVACRVRHRHPFVGRPRLHVCIAEERWYLVVVIHCLWGLAHLVDNRTAFHLVTSGSGDFGLPQSRLPSPLLQEPSTAVGQVLCDSVIHLVS